MKIKGEKVKIGQEVTRYSGTDSYPYVVVSVVNPRRIMVESNTKELHKKVEIINLSLRKDGKWREIGRADNYSWYIVHKMLLNNKNNKIHLAPHF
jgi:hypothetical protein